MAKDIWVGANETYKTLASAIKASAAGDTIYVRAGTYTNDWATIGHPLRIVGVDGRAHLRNTDYVSNEKGILVTRADVVIENMEFSGAKVWDQNGAGIRHEAGSLTIRNSFFHDNENGILANDNAAGRITIDGSEFARNGAGDGYTHGIYVNRIAELTVTNSKFYGTPVGHLVKSRAERTTVENSDLSDGAAGSASYLIDIPNGGAAVVRGNTLHKGAQADNRVIVSFGAEGPRATNSLLVEGNRFSSDMPGTTAVYNGSSAVAQLVGNTISDPEITTVASGPHKITTGTAPAPSPNAVPDARDDAAATDAATAVKVAVLANDADADGHSLALASVMQPANGTAVINADGTITYTPNAGFSGTDGFSYTVKDPLGATDAAKVTVTVKAPVVAPTEPTPTEPAPTPTTPSSRDAVPTEAQMPGETHYKLSSYVLKAGQDNIIMLGTGGYTGDGNSGSNYIVGNGAGNLIRGNDGDDFLYGNGGADKLYGGNGGDRLWGGAGNDYLSGGAGKDVLVGGSGADRFAVTEAYQSRPGVDHRDVILDFTRAEGDRIDLSGVDASTRSTGNQAFSFIGGNAFSGKAGQLHVVATNNGLLVEGDVNGDKVADIQVEVHGAASLAAGDFVL